ncbi:LysR family transcriptional regulator [Enterobacillus tribolii]|uniref:DNA-binding transcriptional LysR family regulator n=1 Tax=Enterobacillus tribolii TaxID=1487935 RepID=A0A370QU60_9GAMM|nr:LysR family transcriptional regulator [Enterobacillus tribolii]MBW7981146.1 LysR family transcriptional regulator [Enterobacillus tribolii]RDK92796.1 DNA-binding transcriptional LysR family regulator [Enterobacillus tribolii]
MYDIDMSTIHVFLTVMDTRSVTLAAELLGSSGASVSRALNKMRERFNDPLFIRTKHGLEPTAVALNITPNLSRALASMQQAISTSGSVSQDDRRRIRIKLCASPVMEFYLLQALQAQQYNFRHVTLLTETHDGDLSKDISRLRARKIDLSLTPQKYADWTIANEPVMEVRPVVLCRKGHPRIGPGFTMAQLEQEEYLSSTMWPSLFADNEVLNPRNKMPIYSSTSLLNLMLLAATSDSILLCSAHFARPFARLMEVQVLEMPESHAVGTIYAHYHKSRSAEPHIMELVDYLRRYAADQDVLPQGR